ncbi:MAG: AAA domain-containing protein [Paludibacteraceae bacterium]|nr:AAA domain-containing protein [Paludibacteraceae bacterium]
MDDKIKDIWNKHIDVQEQLLRARAVPIPVVPASTRIVGEKLLMSVDERNQTDSMLKEIANTYSLSKEELNFSNGYFYVDTNISNQVDFATKQRLSEAAEHNFIKLGSRPIVDGIIRQKNKSLVALLKNNHCDFSFDKKGRLQIAINDLKQIQSILVSQDVFIPDTASIIFRFTPSPLSFLSQLVPNIPWKHETTIAEDKKDNINRKSFITVENGYLSDSLIQFLNEQIGLSLHNYTFTFYVNKEAISKYDVKTQNFGLPKINDDGCSFSFTTQIRKEKTVDDLNGWFEEQFDFNFKFTRLKRQFDRLFGKDNITYTSKFRYRYDIKKFSNEFLSKQNNWEEPFWSTLYQTLQIQEGISISPNYEIGVDFNWREESLKDVLGRVSDTCPHIVLSYYDNHRCNVDLKYQNTSLKDLEDKLREPFPSIQFQSNVKDGTLYFFQEYSDSTKYKQLVRSLQDELKELDSSYSYDVYACPEGKEKYRLSLDNDSLQESLSDSVKDLRGCDFWAKDFKLGKLIRVNFPQLTFDISSTDNKQISYLIDNDQLRYITPDITGDLEKITRLKKSFSAISSGKGLHNSNLSEFIFDASKAKPIQDIDFYTNTQSDFYKDVNDNLLNTKVNDSQKQAIIKTLLAEDLSLIQGPPGTGKSTAIAEIIWQHIRIGLRAKKPQRILLTSETNLAVDNAIARVVNSTHNLVKPIRIGGEEKLEMEGKQFNIDTLKQWVETGSLSYSDTEDDSDDEQEDNISQKIILDNWLSNISNRIDKSQMSKDVYELWKNMLNNPTKETRQIVFGKYIHNCNVVGATCSSIGDKSTKGAPTGFFRTYCELFGNVQNRTNKDGKNVSTYNGTIRFETVIQDESSKATPAELSLPLIYGKKNIIIGDHRQLPPLLDKEEFLSTLKFLSNKTNDEKKLNETHKLQMFVEKHFKEMEISHFQRLFESIHDSLKGVFNTQYRMHPAINEVIKQFYIKDGGLECGLDISQVEDSNLSNPHSRYHGLDIDGFITPEKHVLWIDTKTPEMLVGTSRVNYGEVEAINKILDKLHQSDCFYNYQALWENDEDKQIGLISFYGKQLKLLKELRKQHRDIPIRISTVDRFQGMERNIIIVSMVRSNCITSDKDQRADYELYPNLGFAEQNDLGFAKSPNRLNVALSRAKRLLVIVGNSDLFRTKEIYDNVYRCIENSPYGKIIKAEEL